MFDVAIIGAGIIGSCAAMELAKYNIRVAIIEKDTDVANATTKANSGIIHAGYDPKHGTFMAKYNVLGCEMAKEICERLDVPYKQIGSLVLAFDDADISNITTLYRRGIENGVPDMELLTPNQVAEIEPNIQKTVKGALLAKSTGVVSPFEYGVAVCENAVANGAKLFLETEVTSIEKNDDTGNFVIKTNSKANPIIDAKYIINAAGVWSDKVHEMIGESEFKIKPVKGEYFLMDKSQGNLVNHVIFQCPDIKGKGVLVSPTSHGNLIVGPDAADIDEKDDVSITKNALDYVKEAAAKTTDKIDYRQSIRNFAGVRATSDQSDFIIGFSKTVPKFLNLAGIKSPGLTCAPAIALDVVQMLKDDGLEMELKDDLITTRKRVRFVDRSAEERKKLVEENPLYGRVICRCETVTEGEIIDELRRPIVPTTIDAIKRRCNAGMGRCQGGFCSPRVTEIISRELGISPLEVRQDKADSYILVGTTKGDEPNA